MTTVTGSKSYLTWDGMTMTSTRKTTMAEHVADTHRKTVPEGTVITGDIVSGDVVERETEESTDAEEGTEAKSSS